jgi:hypothetical protein
MNHQKADLARWIAQQQQQSDIARQSLDSPQLHLHHHEAPIVDSEPQAVRMHPLITAAYMLLLSLSISLPLALIAAIVDAGNRPSVQYVQPSQGGW